MPSDKLLDEIQEAYVQDPYFRTVERLVNWHTHTYLTYIS